ncbi:uncharacterized protein LOC126273227 [Schistocerca gregaria]|uniref:uncharacterized protein LOC126273227 n=1 Tax=Schistocerca gregaria TaxID=7010 RepID=UPI00211E5964|nr:uncharacterized protein LOC126273227 [Schistocerca gregaria]
MKLTLGKKQIIALDGNDSRITEKEEVLKFIRDFYSNLYSNPRENLSVPKLNDVPSVPDILPSEVKCAIDTMKKGIVPGDDELSVDILKLAGEVTINHLAKVFTSCLHYASIPLSWNKAKIIFIHKKGSTEYQNKLLIIVYLLVS